MKKLEPDVNRRLILKGSATALGLATVSSFPFGSSLAASFPARNIKVYVPTRCLLYTSPSPRDLSTSRMPSSA